jgi:hypothetical protein
MLVVVAAMVIPSGLAAQSPAHDQPSLPRWEVGPYIGVARQSPAGRYLGVIPDRYHLFLGLHRVVHSRGSRCGGQGTGRSFCFQA